MEIVFIFAAPWDWLLTMSDNDNGYLILKDDLPTAMWHEVPDENGYIHHEVDTAFLEERKVDLSASNAKVCEQLCRILKGTNKTIIDPPKKATLTYDTILQEAGPVGTMMPREPHERGMDFKLRNDEVCDADADDTVDDPPPVQADDSEEAATEQQEAGLGPNAKEFKRSTQLIEFLLRECRTK